MDGPGGEAAYFLKKNSTLSSRIRSPIGVHSGLCGVDLGFYTVVNFFVVKEAFGSTHDVYSFFILGAFLAFI
jgi:hypothetical protein